MIAEKEMQLRNMKAQPGTRESVFCSLPAGDTNMMILGCASTSCGTVDGRNPAPPGMYKTLTIMGYLPYQLVQDFIHQQ